MCTPVYELYSSLAPALFCLWPNGKLHCRLLAHMQGETSFSTYLIGDEACILVTLLRLCDRLRGENDAHLITRTRHICECLTFDDNDVELQELTQTLITIDLTSVSFSHSYYITGETSIHKGLSLIPHLLIWKYI